MNDARTGPGEKLDLGRHKLRGVDADERGSHETELIEPRERPQAPCLNGGGDFCGGLVQMDMNRHFQLVGQ